MTAERTVQAEARLLRWLVRLAGPGTPPGQHMGWVRAKVVVLAVHHVAACVLVGAAAILTTLRRSGEVHWVVGVALVAIASLAVTDVRRTKRAIAIGEAQQREVEAAERARRTVEHRFQTVFESHLVPLAIAREGGHVFEANDAWLRLVGRTREESLAQPRSRATPSCPRSGSGSGQR